MSAGWQAGHARRPAIAVQRDHGEAATRAQVAFPAKQVLGDQFHVAFGDVMKGSILTRFGQLTPAYVLQVLAPLVLVFLGHGVLSQERERGSGLQGLKPAALRQGAGFRAGSMRITTKESLQR